MGQDTTVRAKWGKALDRGGFQALPNLLLAKQGSLGLKSLDIVVLLHFNRFWWACDEDPYPDRRRIAARIGVSVRTVERSLSRLEEKGLIERLDTRELPDGGFVRPVSLRPLADRLKRIASESGKESGHPAEDAERQA